MNTSILKQYNIQFYYNEIRGAFPKGSWICIYLYIFRDPEDVQDFMDAIELAINDNFDALGELYDWTASDGGIVNNRLFFAEIREDGNFKIWQKNYEEKRTILIPLVDWKEILLSWKEFLESYL